AAGSVGTCLVPGLLARGDVDARQHQSEADEVEKLRTFAEKSEGHRRPEHGYHMKERGRAVGADQLNAAVEAEIGDRRRKYRDIDERQHVLGIERHHWPAMKFPDEERNQAGGATAESEADQREGMYRGALQCQHRIKPETDHRNAEDQVTLVEANAGKRRDVAAGQDYQHTNERDQHAERLRQRQAYAEKDQGPYRDDERASGLQQQRVQRLRMFERPILHRVEDTDAGKRKHYHYWKLSANCGPILIQVLPGKGQDQEERERPAQERQRHRRDVACGEAADYGIGGPAQRGNAQQEIGLVCNPA